MTTEFPQPFDLETDSGMAHLLQAAGARAEVSAATLLELRTVAHAAWQEKIRRRRQERQRLWSLAAALAGVALGGAWLWNTVWHPVEATVVAAFPATDAVAASTWEPGQGIRRGRSIETTSESRLALSLASGGVLRLDRSTELVIEGPGTFDLRSGAVYLSTEGTDGAFEVRTPLGVVRDIGTRFSVRHDGEDLTVRVRDGAVEVVTPEKAEGRRLDGGVTGVFSRGEARVTAFAAYASDWDWVVGAAPPVDVVGRTIGEVLEEVAEETGREVRFATEDMARRAKSARVGGRVAPISPAHALDVVLAGAGWTSRIDGGELLIEQSPSQAAEPLGE